MEASAGIADAFDEDTLDKAVHVLVVAADERRIGAPSLSNVFERLFKRVGFGGRQDAGSCQRASPGDAAGHVFFEHPAVEPERLPELERRRVRRRVETSRPERRHEVAVVAAAGTDSYNANGDLRPTTRQSPLNSFMRMTPVTRS